MKSQKLVQTLLVAGGILVCIVFPSSVREAATGYKQVGWPFPHGSSTGEFDAHGGWMSSHIRMLPFLGDVLVGAAIGIVLFLLLRLSMRWSERG